MTIRRIITHKIKATSLEILNMVDLTKMSSQQRNIDKEIKDEEFA